MTKKDEVEVEILKHFAILKESSNGWTQEINLVSWYGNDAKYDIRWWSPGKVLTGKGITLSEKELYLLKNVLLNL